MMREGLTITHSSAWRAPKTIEALAGPTTSAMASRSASRRRLTLLKWVEQCRAGFLSDSLYSVKFRDSLRLAAAVAVVGYSEAVGLVAQVLYHPQSLAVFVDIERNAVTRKIDFLKALRNADHSYFALSPISSRASTAADS